MTELIVSLLSGAAGGLGAGKLMPKFSLGNVGNIIAGLLGGGMGSQIISSLTSASVGGTAMSIEGILGNVAGGGVGGGVLLLLVGFVKKLLKK